MKRTVEERRDTVDQATNGDVDVFTKLPRESYLSRGWFEQELERIFFCNWLYAGHESEIRDSGDFITRDIGPESVLVTRSADGVIHAFFNVCRHRGARICQEHRGTAKRFVCPYHRWTYGLDGKLIASPGMPKDFDRSGYPLHRAHVRSWNGLLFVNLSETAPEPLESIFEPAEAELERFDVAGCKIAHVVSYDVRANWKVVLENYYECYHCPGSHPELCKTFDLSDNPGGVFEGARTHPLLEYGPLPIKPGARSFTMTGEPVCKRLMGDLREDDLPTNTGFGLHPTTSGIFTGDYGIVFDFQPLSEATTRVRCQWLVAGDAREGTDYDVPSLIELWDVTNRQDWPLCEMAQKGIASRRYVPGPQSVEREPAIEGFRVGYLTMLGEV